MERRCPTREYVAVARREGQCRDPARDDVRDEQDEQMRRMPPHGSFVARRREDDEKK
jgi:hypothetical protein